MTFHEIMLAIFLGTVILVMDFTLACGVNYFWHEKHRLVSVMFALVAVALTAAYACTVINRVFG